MRQDSYQVSSTRSHCMSHSSYIPHQSQLVPKSTRTQVNSYTGQLAPMSHLSQVASKSSRIQVNSYPYHQLAPKSTRTQVNSHPNKFATKSTRTQVPVNSHLSQLPSKSAHTRVNSLYSPFLHYRLVSC